MVVNQQRTGLRKFSFEFTVFASRIKGVLMSEDWNGVSVYLQLLETCYFLLLLLTSCCLINKLEFYFCVGDFLAWLSE